MPTVPTLNPYGVKEEAAPNVGIKAVAPIEAFGGRDKDSKGNVFGALEDFANTTSKMAVEAKKDADDTMIEKWKAHLTDYGNESLWNSEKGAYAQKGEKALNLKESYGGELDKEISRIYEKELHNTDQRQRFSAFADSYKSQYNGQLDKHSFGEYQEVQKNTMTSSISASERDAVLNYMEPGRVDQTLMKQDQTWRDYAAKQGMSPEQTEEGLVKIQSSTHKSVLTRMLDNNQDLTAQAYFKRTKKSMTADDLVQVEKVLEEGSTLGEAQRKSLAIFTKSESKTDALAAVDGISNPKVQQKTRDLLNQRYSDQAAAKKDASEQNYAAGYKFLKENGNDYNAIPASIRATLTPEHDQKLQELAKKGPVTDWNNYYELKTLATQDPKTFSQINLLEYRPSLDDPEFKEMTNLQKQVQEKKGGADAVLAGFRTTSMIVNDTLRDMGFPPTPKVGSEDANKVNHFRRLVDEQILLKQSQSGKKATTEDVQNIVDVLGTKVITDKGWFWDTKKRAFEVGNKDFQVDADAIPKSERTKIEAAWKRKYPNTPVTEAQIIQMYTGKLKGFSGN